MNAASPSPRAATRGGEFVVPDTVTVVAWSDAVVDAVGFRPDDPYVELLWLPIVGPSGTLLYRRLAMLARSTPTGTDVELITLAHAIGLSSNTTVHVQRALRRVIRFGLARWDGNLAVRTVTPPLPERLVARLATTLQTAHRDLTAARIGPRC